MMALSCNQAGLLAWMLLLLSLSEVQSDCPTPVLPLHSSLRAGELADTYIVGTVLRLQCISGYEYISGTAPRMTCLGTSKWSDLPTLCQGRRCPIPNIENGRIVSSDDLRLGEEITLACDYGFRIIGGNTRRCILKSGKVDWNREVPYCERIPCARPAVIPNGRYDPNPSDTYDAGWIVIYRCDPEYSLIGNSTITCIVAKNGVDGEWNWPSPECKIVKCDEPKVENGELVILPKPSYDYNDGISFECNSGYSAVGSLYIKCGANSSWVPAIPKCVKDNCTSPIPPPDSTLKEDIPKEGYPVGTVLTYHCITGYEYIPEINPSITCLNTSKWSEISSLCRGKQCPAPNIENGNTDADDDNDIRLGGNVTFSCVHGYRLVGEATLKCILKDGKVDWNREFPFCEHIPCSRPDNILNGQFDRDPKDEYNIGSVVIYRCNRDYSLIGNSTIKCITTEDGQNGKWDLPAPECKIVKCDEPKVENGKLVNLPKPSYDYNDGISFECNSGYSAVGSLHIKCAANSSWVPVIPKCVKGKQCPAPNIENGNTDADDDDDIRLGGNVTFSCVHGYRLVGEATLKCILKDGKVVWNREFPFCEHIPCSRPDNILNGQFDPDPKDEYNIGSVVIYRCNKDFSLIGNSHIRCITTEDGRNGKWDLPAPECKKVKCHRPSIPNGKVASVYQATYTYQNKIKIECNPGYTLIGSSLVECDADSQWKPCVPRCDKDKSLEERLDIIEKKLDLILQILQLTGYRKTN